MVAQDHNQASQSASPALAAQGARTWRPDPDRFIRRVKGGRYQARPHNAVTRERINLGTFATIDQARVAIRKYWWGQIEPKPKFVRLWRNQYWHERDEPPRYFVVIPTAAPEGGKRGWKRVGGWYASEPEAAAAAKQFLVASFGRLVAEAMLSRKDTSRRAGRY